MGHEIAHALREHGRERMSEEMIKNVGLQVLLATGKLDSKYAGIADQLTIGDGFLAAQSRTRI